MTIVHDAYLFDLEAFSSAIQASMQATPQLGSAYSALRENALDLYGSSSTVRSLCMRYGGWTRSSIEGAFPAEAARDTDDFAFWISILLFGGLAIEGPGDLGLGSAYDHLPSLLDAAGWEDKDRRLLVYGRPFAEVQLSPRFNLLQSEPAVSVEDVLARLRPFSVGGHSGWLGIDDSNELSSRLITVHTHAGQHDMLAARDNALRMLDRAIREQMDLCLILSG